MNVASLRTALAKLREEVDARSRGGVIVVNVAGVQDVAGAIESARASAAVRGRNPPHVVLVDRDEEPVTQEIR